MNGNGYRIDPSNHLVDPSLDPLLYVCTEIIALESLHYGYWDRPEAVDPARTGLEAFRRARPPIPRRCWT